MGVGESKDWSCLPVCVLQQAKLCADLLRLPAVISIRSVQEAGIMQSPWHSKLSSFKFDSLTKL